jgi:hypothetical protein
MPECEMELQGSFHACVPLAHRLAAMLGCPQMPTEADHVDAVKKPGRYNAVVGSESEARRIVQQALPHAVEVAPAVAGKPYPRPDPNAKAWFQVQPAEPAVNHAWPHIKYEDWTGGKKFKGGRWGHLFFPPS